MIGIVEGLLIAAKVKQPGQGDSFKSHQILSVTQVHDGEGETVKVKDLDVTRTHKVNSPVKLKCKIMHWINGTNSGQSVSVLEVL